jgi:signal transduction histidine kinase
MVMRAHGGDLAFDSAPGQGITATLTIPASRVVQDGGFDAN